MKYFSNDKMFCSYLHYNIHTYPIHEAIRKKDLAKVKDLIKKNSTIDILNADGNSPLHLAVEVNSCEIARCLLVAGAKVNTKNIKGQTALQKAVSSGDFLTYMLLMRYDADLHIVDKFGHNILHYAVISKDQLLVKYCLINKNMNINATNIMNETPVYIAVMHDNFTMVKLLLLYKADVNIKCTDDFLPIDTAVINHNLKMIKLLLSNGSTLTQKSLNMFIAGECNGDSIKILELFVLNGIDLDHYSKNNNITFVELMQDDNCFAAIELIKTDKLAIEMNTSIEQNTSILAQNNVNISDNDIT